MNWIDEMNKNTESLTEILSFSEYMNVFENNSHRECRPTCKYLLDMLDHFGQTEDKKLKLFEMEHPDSPPIFGQTKTQKSIYLNLKNFLEEGFNNKFLLLIGPNGSSKSSIIRKFMKGAEEYSKTSHGTLYTFSWVFPIDNYIKGTLGLSSENQSHNVDSYAHLGDTEITAILPSELKDHPILLIPREYRQKLIDEKLGNDHSLYETVKKSYIYLGDISKRNRMIYDALLKNYKGDHQEVLKHIKIERFTISKRYSIGAVTIEPQLHVDARLQQISMDKRLASLPPSLQSLNLFMIQGEAILANRGILEYSDLLKRPIDTYKYLLMTMETKTINLQGILTDLDIFFIGTSNEVHFEGFKQHPDFKSFSGRFNFIKVPYLLNFNDEEKIYLEQIKGLREKSIFEPHSLNILSIFSVMTRLRAPQGGNYTNNNKLSPLATGLNPLEKALLITNGELPNRLDIESKQILKMGLDEITNEFANDTMYEGKFGLSPREIKQIIYDLTTKHSSITFVEILDFLKKLIMKRNEYDFLSITPQGDYHNLSRFIALLKEHVMNIFDGELRNCLGLVDDRSYEDYTKRYIQNINALIKGEKIKNEITGKFEGFDDFFIKEFEAGISLKENPEVFRTQLISQLGAYSLDNPGKKIIFSDVFPGLIKNLKKTFEEEQKKFILNIANNLVFYEAEITNKTQNQASVKTPLSEENRNNIIKVVENLMSKYGYTRNGIIATLKYVITNRY